MQIDVDLDLDLSDLDHTGNIRIRKMIQIKMYVYYRYRWRAKKGEKRRTATHCTALQIYCKTLQYTTTHCNTLPRRKRIKYKSKYKNK